MDEFKSPISLRGDHYWCPLSLQIDAYWQCVGCPMCYLRRMNRTWDKARDEKATQDYLADWAGEKGDGVFDPDRMVEAVLGELPQGLASRITLLVKGKPLGVSVIDSGIDCWVNYRYCLVSPGLPGLSEFCRMLTWDYIARNTAFKLINDGGGLDRPGLEQFKDKLCPDHKLNVPTTKE